ncbi:Aste57867_25333 [Aphanomyces stellatus]|uniref:Aste57867_25333 protein n=1 Tax=Aphanomyces stellatus TaxID=120398 RepID=A0A485LTJ2_9STRA|nr:hypothetical protein As57867_025255 [Aphanomyces stellatus]VFU01958.1 Aste57867_25333 [Aphanomyces stellatus]
MMHPSEEAMLMYVRSIKAPEAKAKPAKVKVDEKKKSFFSGLSFRKSRQPDDDDETSRWSLSMVDRLSLSMDERKRSGSFLSRLSFLKPRESGKRLEKVASIEVDPDTDTDTVTDDLATSPAVSPTAAPMSPPRVSMMARRIGVPNYHNAPRRHTMSFAGSRRSSVMVFVESVKAAEVAAMALEDVNMSVNPAEVAAMELEDVDVKQIVVTKADIQRMMTMARRRRAKQVAVVSIPSAPMPLCIDAPSDAWFDETLAMLHASSF